MIGFAAKLVFQAFLEYEIKSGLRMLLFFKYMFGVIVSWLE